MHTQKKPSSDAIVKPLRKCVLRCDPFLRQLSGGTYGYTRTDANGKKKFHGGVDLYAEPGTETFAIYKGKVEWTLDFKNKGWGKCILAKVELPTRTCWTLYAHLSEIYVKKGTPLEAGTLIGLTGISGNGDSNYPHLHFEAWLSTSAGKKGSAEEYRFDPLEMLGFLPYQPYALEVLDRHRQA
jgi:murein DD-endopeptidase MepM/ murein hydrolase activator NlpD